MSRLVDQSVKIMTSLSAGLDTFKANPERRGGILTSMAQTIAGLTGRKALPVKISGQGVYVSHKEISIGQDVVDKALGWEESGVEKGSSAVFGDVARAIAKRTGNEEFQETSSIVKDLAVNITADPRLQEVIGDSIASYTSVAHNLEKLIDEFPGLGGAIVASYVVGADQMNPREGFNSESNLERWKSIWTTLIAEALTPGAVPDEAYPDEETRDGIRRLAGLLADAVNSETGNADTEKVGDVVQEMAEMFEGASDGVAEPMEGVNAANGVDEGVVAVPVDDRRGGGIGQDLGGGVSVKDQVSSTPVKDSPLTASMREYLLDVRQENAPGQQTGRINSQLHRIVTDRRVFSKRVRVVEPPDACVVIAVDYSSSMDGFGRLESALKLHDALAFALTDMDIAVASCAYCGRGDNDSQVFPVNLPHKMPVQSAHAFYPGAVRGNGDVGAMLWSTKQIELSGAKMGAVIFLADGDITQATGQAFTKKAAELGTSVFHVDYLGATVSPFGGVHIDANYKSINEVAQPLARGLAEALGLE